MNLDLPHQEIEEKFRVPTQIHEEDYLYKFLLHHLEDPSKAFTHYFENARESALRIREIILNNVQPIGIASLDTNAFSLLDFASGFGMVNRHFSVVIPEASFEACDIHPKAVVFHNDILGVKCYKSSSNPFCLSIPRKYDVVVALSFFSHMPKQSWLPWLHQLSERVAEGGLLIFTTHGPASSIASMHKLIEKDIYFYFYPDSEQEDLKQSDYGTAYAHPDYVLQFTRKLENMHLSEYKQGAWWGGTQDYYVFAKRNSMQQVVTKFQIK